MNNYTTSYTSYLWNNVFSVFNSAPQDQIPDENETLVICCKDGNIFYASELIFFESSWFYNEFRLNGLPWEEVECPDNVTRKKIDFCHENGYSYEVVKAGLNFQKHHDLSELQKLPQHLLMEVRDFAEYVSLKDVVNECENLLLSSIRNWKEALEWTKHARSPKLQGHICDLLSADFKNITEFENWPEFFTHLTLANILENQKFALSPYDAFCAIVNWALFSASKNVKEEDVANEAGKLLFQEISETRTYNLVSLIKFEELSVSEFESLQQPYNLPYNLFLPNKTLKGCFKFRAKILYYACNEENIELLLNNIKNVVYYKFEKIPNPENIVWRLKINTNKNFLLDQYPLFIYRVSKKGKIKRYTTSDFYAKINHSQQSILSRYINKETTKMEGNFELLEKYKLDEFGGVEYEYQYSDNESASFFQRLKNNISHLWV